jgi:hypothetical protein
MAGEAILSEDNSSTNSLGKTLRNALRKQRGGEFPVTATLADVRNALASVNKDTSEWMVRLGAKALEAAGVRVQGLDAGTMEARSKDVDFLINSASSGVSITESLRLIRESKSKARQSAEKMARKAGKKQDDEDWEATVDKFEKNQSESVMEQDELKGTDGLVAALKDAIKMLGTPEDDEGKKKLEAWKKLLDTFKETKSESFLGLHEDTAGDLDQMREKLDKIATSMDDPKAKEKANEIRRALGDLKGML